MNDIRSKIYNLTLENDPTIKFEIEVDLLRGFYIRVYDKGKFSNPIILVEQYYEDLQIILDDEKFIDIVIDILNLTIIRKELLMQVDKRLLSLKKLSLHEE